MRKVRDVFEGTRPQKEAFPSQVFQRLTKSVLAPGRSLKVDNVRACFLMVLQFK